MIGRNGHQIPAKAMRDVGPHESDEVARVDVCNGDNGDNGDKESAEHQRAKVPFAHIAIVQGFARDYRVRPEAAVRQSGRSGRSTQRKRQFRREQTFNRPKR
jgi:hypothetical protein